MQTANGKDFVVCKLKARVNLHGILSVESGYYVEEEEVEEPIPESKDADVSETMDDDVIMDADRSKAMDTDAANGEAKAPKTRKVKTQVRKGDLPISQGTTSLDTSLVTRFLEQENAMTMEDKLVSDTEDKKNELESFIYELRGKIDDDYAEFASDEEKEKVKAKLEQIEEWLYDDGEDSTKAVYISKIDEIRFSAGPIIQRYNDKREEERQALLKIQEEEAAKKKAEEEAARKAAEEKKAAEEAAAKAAAADQEMTDAPAEAEAVKADGVEEA